MSKKPNVASIVYLHCSCRRVTIGLGVVVALVIGSILTAILSVYDLAL